MAYVHHTNFENVANVPYPVAGIILSDCVCLFRPVHTYVCMYCVRLLCKYSKVVFTHRNWLCCLLFVFIPCPLFVCLWCRELSRFVPSLRTSRPPFLRCLRVYRPLSLWSASSDFTSYEWVVLLCVYTCMYVLRCSVMFVSVVFCLFFVLFRHVSEWFCFVCTPVCMCVEVFCYVC